MRNTTNNVQTHWTYDPAQQKEFFAEVDSKIKPEVKRAIKSYGPSVDSEDFEQDYRLKLWQQMRTMDADGPFAKDSPKEAADCLVNNYQIHNDVQSNARELGRKQRRRAKILEQGRKQGEILGQRGRAAIIIQKSQAEIFAGVRPKDLPEDAQTRFLAAARTIRVITEESDLTSTERDFVRKALLRRIDVDDLPGPFHRQATQAAGVSSAGQRAFDASHDKHGQSTRERKALSRALAKVKKVFDKAKFLSLLTIVVALSLSLAFSIHQGRSDHQDDLVNQRSLSHQNDLARQGNLIQQNARAHQAT